MRNATAQLEFARHSGWGGKRKGAGRHPKGERAGVSHAARPDHQACHPVHVTLRALAVVGCLRDCPVFNALFDALAAASNDAFRVAHFSVQGNHLHLIIEAHDRRTFSRGMQGLAIRTACPRASEQSTTASRKGTPICTAASP